MKRRRLLKIMAATACLPALGAPPAEAETWQGLAMGADVAVTLAGPGAAEALAGVPAFLDRMEAIFSLYREESELSRLNRQGLLERPSEEMLSVLYLSGAVNRLTFGLFDPTVQPLWRALAEGGDIERARAAIGFGRVRIGPDRIALGSGQALTLNGIAQGFVAERLKTALARAGFVQALCDCGEYAALGGAFTVGLEDPSAGRLGTISLAGTALAVSSPGAMTVGGVAHIIGPHGERPTWSTVAVEAGDAGLADAFATAAVFIERTALADILRADRRFRRIVMVDDAGGLETLTRDG